jgi:acyl dehydratase
MGDLTRTRGLHFEEFQIGDQIESPGRTITEADVATFAGLSGDYNQLHTDAEFCRDTLYGERIAHGLLGLSIASGLAARLGFVEGTAQAFTGLDWKFRGPMKIGDTIRGRFGVMKKRKMSSLGGGFVVFSVTVLNQRDETVQKGTWTLLVKSTP